MKCKKCGHSGHIEEFRQMFNELSCENCGLVGEGDFFIFSEEEKEA